MANRNLHAKKIREGMARSRALGGRAPGGQQKVTDAEIRAVSHLSLTEGAEAVGLSRAQFALRRRQIREADARG